MRKILDIIADSIVIIGKDFKIVFANKAMLELCRLKEDDIIGRMCHEIFHGCHEPCGAACLFDALCPLAKIFKTGKAVSVTHRHIMPNGRELFSDITASPLRDEKGEVIQIIEVLRDVTEKEVMRKKLEEQESFLESILEGIGDGVVVIDRDFKIISANKGYCSQVKMSCDEMIGKHCYEVSHHLSKPCYENGEECSVKEAFETGSSHRIIHTHFDKENKPIYIETVSYPLKNESGNIVSAIEVLTDVTGRFGLEKNLKEKVKELEEFYDMAVGRELKMMELKEEIERLKEELEKHKKS